jgi:hypothetical protein
MSESRGREASGAVFLDNQTLKVAKHAIAASDLIRRTAWKEAARLAFSEHQEQAHAVLGHSRLVTNGGAHVHDNNQPVVAAGMVGIHNGIVTNVDDLWQKHAKLDRTCEIDTAVLFALLRKFIDDGLDLSAATRAVFSEIEGGASIAVTFTDSDRVLLATNTGSLYTSLNESGKSLIFASERFILEQVVSRLGSSSGFELSSVAHMKAGCGIVIDLLTLEHTPFSLTGDDAIAFGNRPEFRQIVDISPMQSAERPVRLPGEGPYFLPSRFVDRYPQHRDAIAHIRRCSKCILPETMPFIEFDQDYVCNYCRYYRPIEFKGSDALKAEMERYRRTDGRPDCLVTFSGGRDSSYGVHFVKNELKMNPVTYTYDWGMVTDLARRNQMRICGKLGIEHILVSADIAHKRGNIRRNVTAWLREPNLGTVPLFMAGDKQYFYYANKVGRQTGCKVIVLCENMLETTRFKAGFCGIAPRHSTEHTYTLTIYDKAKMAMYYGWQYLTNPAYLNRSMLDTVKAFGSYYVMNHPYLNLFSYLPWDEDEINNTLIDRYKWETSSDTDSTWRIGDGTAAFYNYIYYTMAGFTENDTFRSNQVREGMITRDEALARSHKENEPRYESMQWYCDIIGVDFYNAVDRINCALKLYDA